MRVYKNSFPPTFGGNQIVEEEQEVTEKPKISANKDKVEEEQDEKIEKTIIEEK